MCDFTKQDVITEYDMQAFLREAKPYLKESGTCLIYCTYENLHSWKRFAKENGYWVNRQIFLMRGPGAGGLRGFKSNKLMPVCAYLILPIHLDGDYYRKFTA